MEFRTLVVFAVTAVVFFIGCSSFSIRQIPDTCESQGLHVRVDLLCSNHADAQCRVECNLARNNCTITMWYGSTQLHDCQLHPSVHVIGRRFSHPTLGEIEF